MEIRRGSAVLCAVFIALVLAVCFYLSAVRDVGKILTDVLKEPPAHSSEVSPVATEDMEFENLKNTENNPPGKQVESKIVDWPRSEEIVLTEDNTQSILVAKKSIASETVDRYLVKALGMFPKMILVKGGTYFMGARDDEHYANYSETPAHKVQLSDYYISKDVVTIDEYNAFDPGKFKSHGEVPAFLNLAEAYDYIAWLSELTGESYRLPTESEWEYMARAGTETPFFTGLCIDAQQANFNLSKATLGDCVLSEISGFRGRRVNSLFLVTDLQAENAWGFRHTLGNLWELTEDCWHLNYINAPADGSAWKRENEGDCAYRVLRGGSTWHGMREIRSSSRHKVDIYWQNFALRLAKNVDAKGK